MTGQRPYGPNDWARFSAAIARQRSVGYTTDYYMDKAHKERSRAAHKGVRALRAWLRRRRRVRTTAGRPPVLEVLRHSGC